VGNSYVAEKATSRRRREKHPERIRLAPNGGRDSRPGGGGVNGAHRAVHGMDRRLGLARSAVITPYMAFRHARCLFARLSLPVFPRIRYPGEGCKVSRLLFTAGKPG
jgi:hypothetical protein